MRSVNRKPEDKCLARSFENLMFEGKTKEEA